MHCQVYILTDLTLVIVLFVMTFVAYDLQF